MANASPRDTRAGFDIYRSAGGAITLDELNGLLYEAGYGPIASRTFSHYRNLLEAGFNRYVSINRFDVARASAPFENASAKSRYTYVDADLGVRVIFAKANKLLETFGRASEIGEVGAMLRFDESEVVDGLRKLKPQAGDMVTVRYLEAGRTVGGRVVEADVKADPALIEIEYARLISIASVGIGEPLPATEARFFLSGPEDDVQTLDLASRRLYHFFELIEGVRALSNEASITQPQPVYAQPAVLKRLSVASPADLVILVAEQVQALFPWGMAAGVLKAVSSLPEKRKQWYEGTGQKKDNKVKDLAIRQQELETALKELDVERKRQEDRLGSEILGRLRSAFPESQLTDEQVSQAYEEHILPPLRALGRIGIHDLTPPNGDVETNNDDEGEQASG